jgi:hypothetical protein
MALSRNSYLSKNIGDFPEEINFGEITYSRINDLRYGTLIARFETAKERLAAYLDGSLAHIEELEAPRLRFDGKPDDAPAFDGMVLWYQYPTYPTVSRL